MKRTLAILLVSALLMSFTALFAHGIDTTGFTPEQLVALKLSLGDTDGDAVITTSDARQTLRFAAELDLPEDDETEFRAAVTGGEHCTTTDARLILRAAAGLEGIAINLTADEIMTYYNSMMTRVKTTKPGFTRDVTAVCPSIKTTLPNSDSYSILGLNYTEPTELSQISSDIDALLKKYDLLLKVYMGNDEYTKFQSDWAAQKESMANMYKPQQETRTVEPSSSYHYSVFPLKGLTNGGLADGAEVTACKLTRLNKSYIIEFTVPEYSCTDLPVSMAEISYGKIFDVPSRSSFIKQDITLNSLVFRNGKVKCTVDIATSSVVLVEHYYEYVYDFTQEYTDEETGNKDSMRTIQTVNNTLKYTVNAYTPEVAQ